MGVITRMRRQDAVYWPVTRIDSQNRVVLGTAVAMKVRWEDKVEAYIDHFGQPQTSQSVIYVPSDVDIRGWLWLGLLAAKPADPTIVREAREIKCFEKLPNFRNTENLRTVRS